jgi:hypothetical protein
VVHRAARNPRAIPSADPNTPIIAAQRVCAEASTLSTYCTRIQFLSSLTDRDAEGIENDEEPDQQRNEARYRHTEAHRGNSILELLSAAPDVTDGVVLGRLVIRDFNSSTGASGSFRTSIRQNCGRD